MRRPPCPAGGVSGSSAWDAYIRFRVRAMERMAELAGMELVQAPGVAAALSPDPSAPGSVLLYEQVPEAALTELLGRGTPQWWALLPPARPLVPVIADGGWTHHEERIGMGLTDLSHLAAPELPAGITVRPVAVRRDSAGFPLEEALRLSLQYAEPTPAPDRDLEVQAALLRRLTGIRFYAAVDANGECVGTAGSRIVDEAALVASVATLPSHRRLGIGTAMTGVALRAARQAGAREAFLDATRAARGIYRRLGFTEFGPVLWCEAAPRS